LKLKVIIFMSAESGFLLTAYQTRVLPFIPTKSGLFFVSKYLWCFGVIPSAIKTQPLTMHLAAPGYKKYICKGKRNGSNRSFFYMRKVYRSSIHCCSDNIYLLNLKKLFDIIIYCFNFSRETGKLFKNGFPFLISS